MTDHEVDTTITRLQPGDLVDVTIRGARVTEERPDGTVVITCEDDRAHGVWPMPPQAAIKRAGHPNPIDAATLQEGITKVLAYLDSLEAEDYLQPGVAATVRKKFGMPPRNWPPRPGDVWDDGMPFGGSLWFARQDLPDPWAAPETAVIVMTSVNVETRAHTPEELLASGAELALVYRKRDER
jgi:hypothetical protein